MLYLKFDLEYSKKGCELTLLNEHDYQSIVACLKELQIFVHEEVDCTEFINYRDSDYNYIIYGISYENDLYFVNTLFGEMKLESLKDVLALLRQDWNKNNWIYEEENGETFVRLKERILSTTPSER
ncbi:TPA: hypothetical protein QC175_005526 [Bacillus cereus]|nr:hypothetical protein [Bacillus cereus]HDR8335844.1 hypothetical protein [Bacillus cereus]